MLTVSHLDFEYPGVRALNKISFTVPAGSITAIVGPNGAGKTTLLRCIATLEEPLDGTILLDGVNVREHPRLCHRHIGYLSDSFGLYDDLTVEQCLRYAALSQAIPVMRQRSAITLAAERTGIASRLTEKAGLLSRGYRQRLAIAQSIIHEPKLVLLDEPASGLDPEARSALAGLFVSLRDQGMTLMVSSHILAELEEYCTDMLIISGGAIAGQRQVRSSHAATALIHVALTGPSPELGGVLAENNGVSDVRLEGSGCWFRFAGDADAQRALLKQLVDRGIPVCAFGQEQAAMQREYLDVVRQVRDRKEAGV